MINPNEPKENSYPVSSADVPHSKPRVHSEDPFEKGSMRSTYELQKSRKDGDAKHFTDTPADDNGSNRSGTDSAHRGQGVGSTDNSRKPSKQTIGSERNFDRSPLHRQAKTPGRDSPSWEVKNSYDTSHGTPGRSRLRPSNRGDETVSFLFSCFMTMCGKKCKSHEYCKSLRFDLGINETFLRK